MVDQAPFTPSDVVNEPGEVQTLQVHAEDIAVSKRLRKTLLRASLTTKIHETRVEESLAHEHVVIERVAVGRIVDEAPMVRQEGDVTIISVVEEVLVTERRLLLKEEVHLRRVKTVQLHSETVSLRKQGVTITRTAIDT